MSSDDTPEMLANAKLRESYLRLVSMLSDKEVELNMFGKMKLHGKFIAFQRNVEHLFVDDFQTPMGVVDHAALRVRDLVSIRVPLDEIVTPKRIKSEI